MERSATAAVDGRRLHDPEKGAISHRMARPAPWVSEDALALAALGRVGANDVAQAVCGIRSPASRNPIRKRPQQNRPVNRRREART
jgi:hypothetical protein